MADITKLSRLVNGLQRNVDLSTNTLVTDSIKVGGPTVNTELTKTILDNLVNLQNGSDAGALHNHDARYHTKAVLSSSTASSGSDLIGDDNTYLSSTPVAATVKGALSGLDTAIGAEVTRAMAAEAVLDDKIDDEITRAMAAEAALQSDIDDEIARALAAEAVLLDAIEAEEARALAAEAALQSQINASNTALSWRVGVIAATADIGLAAAIDGEELAPLLPFSDDEGSQLSIADFEADQYLLSKNGAASKLWKIYDDMGTLKLTDVGFTEIRLHDSFVVQYDLLDSPDAQEGVAIYTFNGDDLVKVADFDWSVADGINLAPGYTAGAGTVVETDSVQVAIQKLDGNIEAEETRAMAAEAANALAISNEITRAMAAEAALQSDIDDEIDRALAAEAALQSDIDDEIARALAAEAALDARIDELEDSASGLSRSSIAGESMDADTSYLVRFAIVGETVGRVYKADKDTTSGDKFYAFGITKSVTPVTAGATIKVNYEGSYTLGSLDTPFSSSDIGKAVYLLSSGAFSVAPPTTTNDAVWRIGMVEDTNKIWIGDKQLNGIN